MRDTENQLTQRNHRRALDADSISADNAAAEVTINAPGPGKRILLEGAQASFSSKTIEDKLLQVIEDPAGTPNVLWGGYNEAAKVLATPNAGALKAAENKAVKVSLAASGSAGVFGVVNVQYLTVPI